MIKGNLKPRIREKDLQKQIIDYLRLCGFVVFKCPSVGIFKQSTQSYIPMPFKGVSDIIACSPWGEFVAVEVKSSGKKPTVDQLWFLNRVNENGGIGIWCDNFSAVAELVDLLEKKHSPTGRFDEGRGVIKKAQ